MIAAVVLDREVGEQRRHHGGGNAQDDEGEEADQRGGHRAHGGKPGGSERLYEIDDTLHGGPLDRSTVSHASDASVRPGKFCRVHGFHLVNENRPGGPARSNNDPADASRTRRRRRGRGPLAPNAMDRSARRGLRGSLIEHRKLSRRRPKKEKVAKTATFCPAYGHTGSRLCRTDWGGHGGSSV